MHLAAGILREMSAEDTGGKRRIFIVDDHPMVREWLTKLINEQSDLMVCGEAEETVEAIKAIVTQQPDAAIVDLSLRGSSGIDLIQKLKRDCPDVAVIVLSMHEESHHAERALQAGARGYIIKRETTKKVIAGIQQVLQGKLFLSESISAGLVEQLVRGRRPGAGSAIETLSDREMQVFKMLGEGRGTRQVGEALGITVKTVQAYCGRIKEKLDIESATELLREAVRFHDSVRK